MNRIGHALLASVLLFTFPWIASAANDAPIELSKFEKEQILQVVNVIRKSIIDEDINTFAMNVSTSEGLTCTDTQYAIKEVNSFLKNKSSYLYMSLFDTKRFLRKCGDSGYPPESPPISDKEFLQSANQSVTIHKLDNDWVEVNFTSPVRTDYPYSWSLHREANTWKVAGGSFIIGRCTCG